MKYSKHNIFRVIWFSLVVVFMLWMWSGFQAHNLPDDTFISTESISVHENTEMISFQTMEQDSTQIIFFQGGLVEPEAYAPLARSLAENGYSVHIIKMPFRLAILGYDELSSLFNLSDSNTDYILMGHSQGAKMAAKFVHENPDLIDGLVLMGTSHPRDFSLSYSTIPILKLYASNDGLASVVEVMENRNMLPIDAKFIEIKGGNHAQFGYMGSLLMDDVASISKEEQLVQVNAEIVRFLKSEFQ